MGTGTIEPKRRLTAHCGVMRPLPFLVAIVLAAPAAAQDTVAAFADLSQVVKKGNVVFVQDEKGARTKGKITELSDASLLIMTGAVPGLLAGHWWNTYSTNEGGGSSPLSFLVFGAPLSLVGGGIGFAIDGAIDGQTLVFRRPGITMSMKF
jgi:hypothetical protein